MGYDYQRIEQKWQKYWEENNTYLVDMYDFSKPKYYVLDIVIVISLLSYIN